MKRIITLLSCGLLGLLNTQSHAGAYIFAGEVNGVDLVTHAPGYSGTGGTLSITIGYVDTGNLPSGAVLTDVEVSIQNVVDLWNDLTPSTGFLSFPLASGEVDYESTLLHELGHSLGLAHVNMATESGFPSDPERNYTKSTDGVADATEFNTADFDVAAGVDTVVGSSDDVRGDDGNLNYFNIATNNPGAIPLPATIDSSTYSRSLGSLPGGHLYAANGDRSVNAANGIPSTETVMQQGAFTTEIQRELSAEDVATIRYANAGIDEVVGGTDDYTINLIYVGEDGSADIVIGFDSAVSGFATSFSSGTGIAFGGVNGGLHAAAVPSDTGASGVNIAFNETASWVFNTVRVPVEVSAFELE